MSREPIDAKLRDLQTAIAVTRKTVQDGILRRVAAENAGHSQMDWGQVLSQFSALGEHSDSLWKCIDPSLSFYVPVPLKPTANHNDVPIFLSTMVEADDGVALPSVPANTDDDGLIEQIKGYNAAVLNCRAAYDRLEAIARAGTKSIGMKRRAVDSLDESEVRSFVEKLK